MPDNLTPLERELLECCRGVLRLGADLDRAGIINSPEINAVREAIRRAESREQKPITDAELRATAEARLPGEPPHTGHARIPREVD